jgi:aspartyl-tRNA(Asn)/glutamyl-tRNA(Gln) amidotransferase subunit A
MSSALDLDAEEIRQRRVRMDAIAKSANARLQDVDIVISPTVPVTAPKLADIAERKAYSRANLSVLRNTCIANLLKFCAITLPVALDGKGMPVGLQCIAPANAEESLLGAALAIEGKLGTGRERLGKPPLAA